MPITEFRQSRETTRIESLGVILKKSVSQKNSLVPNTIVSESEIIREVQNRGLEMNRPKLRNLV